MNKEIKTITKILMMIIISIAVLLILPTQVSAEEVLYPIEWKSGQDTFSLNRGRKR